MLTARSSGDNYEGSQSSEQRRLITSDTPDSSNITNFVPISGRSSEIRAQAKIESEGFSTQRDQFRRKSLPTIHERDEKGNWKS